MTSAKREWALAIDLFGRNEFLASLDKRDLTRLARNSRAEICQAGQAIVINNRPSERFYVLEDGKVVVYVRLQHGSHCGGEGVALLADEGQIFGWAAVAKEDRLAASVWSAEESRVVAIDVGQLAFSGTSLRLSRRLAASLFALLQRLGLCPLNVGALEQLAKPVRACGLEECMIW